MAQKASYYLSFANKYYTLWYVEEEHIIDNTRGYEFDDVRATYIKNVSMNKETAIAKYPDTPWNTTLQGKSRSFSYHTNMKPIETYSFTMGRYKGMKYADCTDYKYMVWYFNSLPSDKREDLTSFMPLIDAVIDNTDYILYETKGRTRSWYSLLTPAEYQQILGEDLYNKQIASTFADGYAIVEVLSNWLDSKSSGFYSLYTKDKYNFLFDEADTVYYPGNYYSEGGNKPAIKGKGKNLKGKIVKLYITRDGIDTHANPNTYLVTKFEILK